MYEEIQRYTVKILLSLVLFLLGAPEYIRAHDNIRVHPYIAEQGFFIWPNDTSHEIYQNLGYGYRDTSTGSMACISSETGTRITEGAKEEDDYDPLADTCTENSSNLGYGFYHHFYNPDMPDPNGLQNSYVGYG